MLGIPKNRQTGPVYETGLPLWSRAGLLQSVADLNVRSNDDFNLAKKFLMNTTLFLKEGRGGAAAVGARVFLVCLLICAGVASAKARKGGAGDGLGVIDAVRATLMGEPTIRLQQQQVEISRGALETSSGAFDSTLDVSVTHEHLQEPLNSAAEAVADSSQRTSDQLGYSVGVQKLLRNGILLNPSASLTHSDVSTIGLPPDSRGRVDFSITVPLLRGLGREATGAEEMAAQKELEGTELTLRHTVSQQVLATVAAYWNYVAAQRSLKELGAAEERARKMLDGIRQLIRGGEQPANQLEQMEANLADKITNRIAGRQRLFQARQELGLAMGLAYERLAMLPPPADDFPELSPVVLRRLRGMLQDFINQSLRLRGDYLAFLAAEERGRILVGAARNGLKPQLDLDLNLGYQGLDQGSTLPVYLSPFGKDVPGASVTVALHFSFPIANRSAKGLYRQRRSSLQQVEIQAYDLKRKICSAIAVALDALENSARQLEQSRFAVKTYRTAVINEREKFRLGTSTLLDLLDIDDRLTSALLKEIRVHAELANAIARLRFETGRLVRVLEKGYSVQRKDLMTVPAIVVTGR